MAGETGGTTRKTAPEWPPYSLSRGDPTLPSNRVASHLRLGRRLWCAAGLGVSLGLTQLPSLSVGTEAQGLWAQEAAGERGDEQSAGTGEQGAILGSRGGHAYNWSDPT